MSTTVQDLRIVISGDMKEALKALDQVGARAQKLSRDVGRAGKTLTRNLTAPLLAVGAAGFKVAGDFEASLARMEGLVGVQREQIDAWRGDIRRLAVDYGSSASVAADALFFITSAGLEGSNAMDVLEASLKASASGLGEVSVIADLATSAMNAYGPDVLGAAQATDVLTAAVREGKLEPAELAGAMGQVLPVASNMGIRFDEVGAAMAAMSRTGTSASEAATQLRSIMTGILKPTADAEAALAEMGLSAAGLRSQIREQGLLATLQTLSAEFGENEDAQARVFGNVRALAGVMDLMGASAEATAGIFAELENTTGTLDAAFEAQQTPMLTFNQLLATLKDLALEIGTAIMPTVTAVMERVTGTVRGLTQFLGALNPAVTTAGVVVGALAAALGPLLLVIGKLLSLVPLVTTGFAAISTAAALPLAPLAAVAAAVVAAVLVWREWGDDIAVLVRAAAVVIRDRLTGVAEFIRSWVGLIVEGFRWWYRNVTQPIVDFVGLAGKWLVDKLGPIVQKSAQILGRFLEIIAPNLARGVGEVVRFVDDVRAEMRRMREGAISEAEEAGEGAGMAMEGLVDPLAGVTAGVTAVGTAATAAQAPMESLAEWARNFTPTIAGVNDELVMLSVNTGSVAHAARDSTDALTETKSAAEEIGDALNRGFTSGLNSLVQFTTQSKSAFAQWGAQIANEIAKVMVKLAAMWALAQLVPGGSFVARALSLPARELGGPGRALRPHLVGERGPEIFVPPASGNFHSNQRSAAMMGPSASDILAQVGPAPSYASPEVAATHDYYRRLFTAALPDWHERGGRL